MNIDKLKPTKKYLFVERYKDKEKNKIIIIGGSFVIGKVISGNEKYKTGTNVIYSSDKTEKLGMGFEPNIEVVNIDNIIGICLDEI